MALWVHQNMEVSDEEIKLEFLVSGSYDGLPSSYQKLRSYLNIHSFNLANLHGLKLPKCFTKTNLTCRQCLVPWSYDTCSLKLLPVKKHKKRSLKRKVGSIKANPKKKVPRNHLILKCKICNSRSHFYLLKSAKTSNVIVQNEIKVQRKKKKKKKDKMCGLHKSLKVFNKKCESSIGSKIKTTSFSSSLDSGKTKNPSGSIHKKVQQTNLQSKNSHSESQLSSIKKQQNNKKKSCINSHANNLQNKSSKKNKNLQKLQKIVQGQKGIVKKTLKDFLTLI